ncbi:MAG: Calx-beta domain-containing protein, partial [Cyanobacteria bacterium J06636_16]
KAPVASSAVPSTVVKSTVAFNANDYDATSGTLTFNPGDLTQTIAVNLYEDLAIEGDEAFMVDLSNAAGATIIDDSGTATITDNDGTQLSTSLITYDFTGTNSQAASFSLFPTQGDSLIGVVATANEEGTAKDVFRSNKGFGVAGETDGSFNDEIDGKGPNGANDGSGGIEELVLTFDNPVKLETVSFTSSNGDDDYIILAGVNQLTTGVSATSPKFLPLDVSTFNGTGTEFTFTVVSDTGSDDYALAGIQVSAI